MLELVEDRWASYVRTAGWVASALYRPYTLTPEVTA
jgi:hypothetical protein